MNIFNRLHNSMVAEWGRGTVRELLIEEAREVLDSLETSTSNCCGAGTSTATWAGHAKSTAIRRATQIVEEEVLGEYESRGTSDSTKIMTANLLVRMRESGLI